VEARVSGDLLVITSCTARKLRTADGHQHTAESLYTGQQHLRLMRGVKVYRDAQQPAGPLRFRILSAYYGLLSPKTKVETYDHTFAGQSAAAIRREAHEKNVPSAIHGALRKRFAGGVLLLGNSYLRACELDEHVKLGGPLVSLCSPAVARRMPRIAGLRTIPLTNADARRFSVGLIALKGELAGRMLSRLADEPRELINLTSASTDILGWLEAAPRMTRENDQTEAA
jgi:hypothetical protein